MRGQAWTQNEIQLLKLCAKYRTPIKRIAMLINRTPTAVSKAICRFKLRKSSSMVKLYQSESRGFDEFGQNRTTHIQSLATKQ
jgi:hypothetical protein